jgi:hypothetical protein
MLLKKTKSYFFRFFDELMKKLESEMTKAECVLFIVACAEFFYIILR